MTDVAVGLDLGTSGLKGVALDPAGAVLAGARADYPTARPEPGAAEQRPADWHAAARAVLATLAEVVAPTRWRGIGLGGMLPTLVTLDASGEPVGAALTWEDARAEDEGERFAAANPDGYRVTGQHLDGRYLLPMFLRLIRVEPERARATRTLLGAKDELFRWLTGELATDPSTAAGYGCFDLTTGGWSDAGRAAGDGVALPPVRPATDTAGLAVTRAVELGLPAGLPVAVGGADSVLGALGLGVRAPGEVGYLAGTSTVILAVSAEPALDPDGRYLVTPLAGQPGWGLELDLLATGSASAWLARLTGTSAAELAAEADATDPADAPVLLPYLAPGEQGALWNPALHGTLLGLALRHERRHLARALQTGVVLESRRCLEVVRSRCGPGALWVDGSVRPALARELAAATRRPVRIGGASSSAVGAALLVAEQLPAPVTAGTIIATEADSARWDVLAERHDAALAAATPYYASR